MNEVFYIADRAVLSDAVALVDMFGQKAGLEALTLADEARDRGNMHHFSRWRQIVRLIPVLVSEEAMGTVH